MNSFLIVGLGNPGEKYEKTRHNIGFQVVDNFLRSNNDDSDFSFDKKHQSELCTIQIDDKKIFLAKPQTFMNNSGQAVRSLMDYYKISPDSLLVIHDDLDISFGKIKFSKDSGPAGHNGVKSVIDHVGSKNFSRLRFGIASDKKPGFFSRFIGSGKNFVLADFNKEENQVIDEKMALAAEAIQYFVENGFESSASKYNSN